MHDAYEAIAILNKLPLHIESIAAFEDYLILGTRQGHLLIYSMTATYESNGKMKCDVKLLRSNKSFAKKPITQVTVVPEVGILLVLSDSGITVHELRQFSFPLITVLGKTKNAHIFVVDVQKQESLTGGVQYFIRLCVAIKRKLQFYYWKNREFLELTNDLGLSDIPRALSWCGESVCVGFRLEYTLIKVNTGELKELFPTGKQWEPVVCRLNNSNLALGKDEQTIFIDSDGNPTLKYAVPWSEIPLALAHDQPYLLGVLPSSIEVRTTEPRLLIQNVPLPKVRYITYCKRGSVFVASNNDVWCLFSVEIQQQISKLIDEKQFELALHLSNIIDNSDAEKQKLVQRIQNMYAFDLFCKRKFKEAMDIFLKLGTDPSQVIGLFPDLLPDEYRNSIEYPDTLPSLQGEELEQGLSALIEYMMEIRNIANKDNPASVMPLTAIVEGQKTIRSKKHLLQIIDTTLLKCYLKVNDALVSSLLRLADNYCHVEECERALKRNQRYSELIILYQYKGLHKKALELIYKQSQKPESQLKGPSKTINYLQHLGKEHLELILEFSEWIIKEHPEEGLKIFTEDLPETEGLPRHDVLQHLSDKNPNLVVPYLEHVIENWNDDSVILHNTLVRMYCDKIQKLYSLLNSPAADENSETLQNVPSQLQETRHRLMQFLENSSRYTAETFPALLLNIGLYEEAAIVMGRLGRHEDVLAIYTLYLRNNQKAENYCLKVYEKDKMGKQDVFVFLLKAYLNPGSLSLNFSRAMPKGEFNKNPDVVMALKILKEHATKIDPEKALDLLPSTVKIKEIQEFLELVLQERYVEQHNIRVLRNLYLGEHLQVFSRKYESQSWKLSLTDLDVCWVCQKRISKSAFARFPNGVIVHYSCKDKYSQVQ